MRYVICFSKTGLIRYTSHLDLMRVFKRAFRRAGIELSYSHGFNPHPRMSFALPLSLGYEGLAELLEFESEQELDTSYISSELKGRLPSGIEIIKTGKTLSLKGSAAGSVISAGYDITLPAPYRDSTASDITSVFSGPGTLNVEKKTKKGEIKSIDIKPFIRSLEVKENHGDLSVGVSLDAGSRSNLSPELVISALSDIVPVLFERADVRVTRVNMDLDVDYKIDWL